MFAQDCIFPQRKIQDHACALAVFWNVAQAQIFAVPDTEACYLLLPEIDTAPLNLADADEGLRQLPLAVAVNPSDPTTSPPLPAGLPPQCRQFPVIISHTSSMRRGSTLPSPALVYLEDYIPAHHHPGQLHGAGTGGAGCPLPSRNGSHGNPVAHGHHFWSLGDKDDGLALLGQIISDLLQFHDFLGREYSGGLIEDQTSAPR